MIPKLKEVELFEYLNIMRKQNAIDGIPIDDLRLVLTGNDSGNYKLVNDCIYYMTFKNKDTGEETKIYCVTNYYNLNDIPSQNGKLKCFNVKKELAKRDIPHCIHENCAKCHVACIDDFQEGKITKK